MKMTLGLLVIKQRLCDCGIDLSFHSSRREASARTYQRCRKLCDSEMEVFRAILGEGVTIERAEQMVAGARRCIYRIRTGES